MAQEQKKGLIPATLDEGLGFGLQAISQVFACFHRPKVDAIVRPEHALLAADLIAGEIEIESLVLRKETFGAQVPFSDIARGVALIAQHFRERDFFQGEPPRVGRGQQTPVFIPPHPRCADGIGDARARRPTTGKQAGPPG